MSALERRYRRLIALYPAWHRARYQAEMLSTLMDGASEQQRAPRLRESVDLLWSALRMRLVPQGVPRGRDPRWQDATGVYAVLAALTLGAVHLMLPLAELGWWQRLNSLPWVEPPWRSFVPSEAVGASLFLVAVVALIGWRVAAAVLAWAAVLAMAIPPLMDYADHPQHAVNAWPSVVCGVTIAACLGVPAASQARRLLGRWLLPLFGLAAVAAGSALWLDAMLAKVVVYGPDRGADVDLWGFVVSRPAQDAFLPWVPSGTPLDTVGGATLLTFATFLVMAIAVLIKVGAPIRRRLLALGAAPIATAVVVGAAFVDATYLGGSRIEARHLDVVDPPANGQWLMLLILPLAVFCIGVLLVRLLEARQGKVALDRSPERQPAE
ncbi:hypothetical protein Cs7R123_48120 [Catellatospora sp. TT07R-123]|uniref:hypothetical protein n=1 Tax=Catellatospora sp. TT07R-123 TaxID=2733863 RepID=UPI001B07D859|nr:hypothetical protein [Catellatospora sp. TT07R-123]GHJ47470.1 hypothetical protein Cs7R123_48120 [Catellatospora sp. TT07R-123]